MRDRGDILNHADIQPCGLQRTDGGLTPGARALYINLNRFHAVLHRSLGSCFSSGLCGKGGGFSGATEAHFARACPGYRIALCIRDSHNGIVERGLDMRRTAFDIFTLTASARGNGLFPEAFVAILSLLAYFFLFAIVFFGPLRVRAFVLERWPLTGRPLRCRTPR